MLRVRVLFVSCSFHVRFVSLLSFRSFRFGSFRVRFFWVCDSFRAVSFRFVRFVSVRFVFVSFHLGSFRFGSCVSVSFRFVFRLVFFRCWFVSFRIVYVSL